jgi:hypothetical protein
VFCVANSSDRAKLIEKLCILSDAVESALWRTADGGRDGCLGKLDEALKKAGRVDKLEAIDWEGSELGFIEEGVYPAAAIGLEFTIEYEKRPILPDMEDLLEIATKWKFTPKLRAKNKVKFVKEDGG